MPGLNLRIRTDRQLHGQLVEIARAEGISLNSHLLRLAAADVSRRRRIDAALGLDWRATDAERAQALSAALAVPLSDVELRHLPADPAAAIGYAVARAARKPRPSTPPSPRSALQAWRAAPDTRRLTGAGVQLRAAKSGAALPKEFLIFAAGENPSTNGVVVFDQRAAELVLTAYREHGTRLMIDLEHQSLFGLAGDAGDARGWADIQLRGGALYAINVEWTPDGARRLRERTQMYTSPAFLSELQERQNIRRVAQLINVAITALPATHGLAPLMR